MNANTHFFALFGLLITGCGTEITPMGGAWSVTGLAFDVNECNMDDVSGQVLPLTFDVATDNTFVLHLDEDLSTNCIVEKGDFDCDLMEVVFDLNSEGVDAVMTAAQNFSGSFSTEHDGEITWDIDYTCEGTQCDSFAEETGISIPCQTSGSGTLAHTGM